MQPTRAPWAAGEPQESSSQQVDPEVIPKHRPHAGHHTGTPVQPLINAHPALPVPNPSAWPKTWEPAKKIIKSDADVNRALKGTTLHNFVAFTMALNESVVGVKNTEPCTVNPAVQKLLNALDKLSQFIKDIPPVTHEVRYGNPAYRDWFDRMQDAAPEFVYDVLGEELGEATIELIPYFIDSFGNRSRIDYGTGHETTFVSFLYCLFCLGVLKEEDCKAVLLKVFNTYLALMREVQTTYWLEPAGSHGVWGLDEYHFFPFLWGAAQLRGHDLVQPKSIANDEVLEVHAEEYMYIDAVLFVRKVKKGPLHETAPMLYDITAVPNWAKVNQGLFKMYQVEVLSKMPIMQHALWGSLMPFPG